MSLQTEIVFLPTTSSSPIYRAAQKVGYPFGHIILICIHTAMRRGEVGALKRSYVTAERSRCRAR